MIKRHRFRHSGLNCTFHGLWSSFPPRQAGSQPEKGLYRLGSPSGPWLNEGFLGTTGRNLENPASLVQAGMVLCFWSTPCSWARACKLVSELLQLWHRQPNEDCRNWVGLVYSCMLAWTFSENISELFLLSQTIIWLKLKVHQTAWKESFLPQVLDSSEAITWKSSSPLCKQVTRQPSGQIYSLSPEEMAPNGQTCERDW